MNSIATGCCDAVALAVTPAHPASDVGPVGPALASKLNVGPVEPVDPVGPVLPVDPVAPVAPVWPVPGEPKPGEPDDPPQAGAIAPRKTIAAEIARPEASVFFLITFSSRILRSAHAFASKLCVSCLIPRELRIRCAIFEQGPDLQRNSVAECAFRAKIQSRHQPSRRVAISRARPSKAHVPQGPNGRRLQRP
jgi:hypothetical protein